MNMLNRLYRYLRAKIATKKLAPQQARNRDLVRAAEIMLIKKYPTPRVGPFDDFPCFVNVVTERQKWFLEMVDSGELKQNRVVLIGDSIGEGARPWLFSVHPKLNIAKSGFWIHHMLRLYQSMRPLWISAGFSPEAFVVETPGGNNLLQRQDVMNVISQFLDFLKQIRADYPQARIIVGDLPSSIVAYIIQNKPRVTMDILQWCRADGNACLLMLVKDFVETNKLLPKNDESLEGVHLTPLGSILFDDAIIRALTNKSLVFVP